MQTYSIPIIGRERYLDERPNPKTVSDSRGVSKVIWPISFDIPVDLLVHLENGRLEWVELNYLTDHGESVEHTLSDFGSFSLFLYHGLLSTVRPMPMPPLADAYETMRKSIKRLLEVSRFQSDLAPGKWKTIFSVQLLAEQWREGEPFLRRLIESKPHPFR